MPWRAEYSKHLIKCVAGEVCIFYKRFTADDMPVVDQGAEFLPKPFSPGELVARVGKMLATGHASERAPTRAAPERLHPADSTPLARIRPTGSHRSS